MTSTIAISPINAALDCIILKITCIILKITIARVLKADSMKILIES